MTASTTAAGPELDDLHTRATRMVTERGPGCSVVADAAVIAALTTDALELRSLRSLLAGLPDDDWQPFDWAVFSLAQEAARAALADCGVTQ